MFYAVKITDKMFLTTSLLAFNDRGRAEAESGYHVFANADELSEVPFDLDELRGVHYSVTGFETAVSDRIYLCDLIFDAIERSQIGAQDDGATEPVQVEEAPEPMRAETVQPVEEEPTVDPIQMDLTEEAFEEEPDLPDFNPEPRITLTDTPRFKYSKRERAVFNFISSRHPEAITTKEIGAKTIDDGKTFNVQTTTLITLKSLNKKLAYNSEPFTLRFTGHCGPKPMKVFIEERKQ